MLYNIEYILFYFLLKYQQALSHDIHDLDALDKVPDIGVMQMVSQRESISRSAFCPVPTPSTTNNSVSNVTLTVPPPVGLASSSSSYECRSNPRDLSKYICLRPMVQQTECLNASVLDCSVTFTVDKNICVTGIQV